MPLIVLRRKLFGDSILGSLEMLPGEGNGTPLQYSCLENPMDCRWPGSSVHEILQARILKWVAIPSPGDLPDLGINPRSPALQADSLLSEPLRKPINI